jgi:hypothetical protein
MIQRWHLIETKTNSNLLHKLLIISTIARKQLFNYSLMNNTMNIHK